MNVAVIGAGTMGIGIAQAVISANHQVVLISESEASVTAGFEHLKMNMDKAIAKGMMTADEKEQNLRKVRLSDQIHEVVDCGMVIEAVPETLKTKLDVLTDTEKNLNKDAIIATNTSSISIDTLAKSLSNPSRFLGLHFFNPAPVMKVVEVVKGTKTSSDVLDAAMGFVQSLGKTPVQVKDSPGFISNRILMIYLNEAINALDQGIATKEAIDDIARLGFNHPMGPLELADFIGLDVCRDIMNAIYVQNGDPKFKPAALLVRMVDDNRLGRKNKRGFYDYK